MIDIFNSTYLSFFNVNSVNNWSLIKQINKFWFASVPSAGSEFVFMILLEILYVPFFIFKQIFVKIQIDNCINLLSFLIRHLDLNCLVLASLKLVKNLRILFIDIIVKHTFNFLTLGSDDPRIASMKNLFPSEISQSGPFTSITFVFYQIEHDLRIHQWSICEYVCFFGHLCQLKLYISIYNN